ncbi:putative O-glycosylation ligase, exosortase A system-associated [Hydrogenophaga sp.]|uniref:putative O-glycosylation ligase, exosortase A system-associated n=1 Tax=Hydrogenophaga sp. TaxID=1904254 RepID=UPI0035AF448A
MRDAVFALMVLCVLPLAIARPFNAYLLWGWTGLLVPTAYFYGFMTDARVNLTFAMLTLGLIVLGKVKWRDYQPNRVTWLYLLWALHATLAFLFAYGNNPYNAQYYEILIKGLLFALAMPFFVRERMHFHAMFIVIALGLGIHGVLNGLKSVASAGGHNMLGPAGTMLEDRNHLSTALALALPILFYLQTYAANRLLRIAYLGGFCLLVLAILGGGSRAGFIAVSVVGLWLVLTTRRKGLALALVMAAVVGFFAFAPEDITSRLSTIKEADEDSSFMGRVIAWKISSAIALANPVFGGGFHAVQVQTIWDTFKTAPSLLDLLNLPVPVFSAKAAHSIYFEVMGDLGFVGLGLFLFIMLRAIWSGLNIKRMAAQLGPSFQWARDMGDMLMLSILAYMVGGASVSIAYLELIYVIVMIMELLRLHLIRSMGNP